MQVHERVWPPMLNAETVQYAFLLIRSADGYARLVRCRLMRKVKPDYVCH
jgi:hypothetical protein